MPGFVFRTPFGDIRRGRPEPWEKVSTSGERLDGTKRDYTWRPPRSLARDLPADFFVALEGFGPDEHRRFAPIGGLELYLHEAYLAGQAVIFRTHELDSGQRQTYRAMKLLYDRSRRAQEHISRRFQSAADLQIRKMAGASDSDRSVVPQDLGLDSQNAGQPWTASRLIDEGRQLAGAQEPGDVSDELAIAYGFFAAGRLRPLELTEEEILPLLQFALYDVSEMEPLPGAAATALVTAIALEMIHKHLDDEPEDFGSWFWGGHNSFVRTIARRRLVKAVGVEEEGVRRVLLDLGWQAHRYVGDCLHAFAQCFMNALPDPLTDAERQAFEDIYSRQAYLGGLPLPLLLDRATVMRPALLSIWQHGADPITIGALHRTLDWFSQIAGHRRQADRRAKQQAVRQISVANVDDIPPPRAAPESDTFRAIGIECARQRGIQCEMCDEEFTCILDDQETDDPAEIPLWLCCACGRVNQRLVVGQAEFKTVGKRLKDE